MKRSLLLSSALVLGSISSTWAGGLSEPVMPPEVIAENTSSSSAGVVVPLLLLLLIAAAASGSNSGGGGAVSDVRLKEDVTAIGMTPQGLGLFRWRYRGLPGVYEGVMAHEVARLHPDAVIRLPFGYKAVNYNRLGMKLRLVA